MGGSQEQLDAAYQRMEAQRAADSARELARLQAERAKKEALLRAAQQRHDENAAQSLQNQINGLNSAMRSH